MARTPHRRPGVPGPDPDTAGALDVGLAGPPLPGGQPHIANQPLPRPGTPGVSHKPYYSGVMAHGVPAPEEAREAAWERHSAPGGKSAAELAREHGTTAGELITASRASEDEPGGLARSEVDELMRQVAGGTGVPLDPGTAYVVPARGWPGRITAPASERAGREATHAVAQVAGPARPEPIGVYIVSEGGGARALSLCSARKVNVPVPGGQPVQVCAQDPKTTGVLLLNESATAIRISDTPGGAATGAVLPASMSSYLWLACQGDLYAIADSGSSTLVLSVITEFSAPGAA
jgi:hypothetical protein